MHEFVLDQLFLVRLFTVYSSFSYSSAPADADVAIPPVTRPAKMLHTVLYSICLLDSSFQDVAIGGKNEIGRSASVGRASRVVFRVSGGFNRLCEWTLFLFVEAVTRARALPTDPIRCGPSLCIGT